MDITDDCVVSFDYTLTSDDGEVIDSSQGAEPLSYLHGRGNIVRGLEKAMAGKSAGDSFKVTVVPDEGYGQRHDELIQDVPRSAFDGIDELAPGMRFQAESDAGPMMVQVTAVADDTVTVDGNHALAGQNLNFEIAITDVREATEQELEHGHVHADGEDH